MAVVLAGPGGNGGGGLVAARHLANRDVEVIVVLGDRDRLDEVPRHQLSILERTGVRVSTDPVTADLVLDALIGYSLDGDPRGRAADLIRWTKEQPSPVCSLDVPSGLHATTGAIGQPRVQATATLTLALPKVGLARAPDVVGELYLADIAIPRAVYAHVGIEIPPIFAAGPILRLV